MVTVYVVLLSAPEFYLLLQLQRGCVDLLCHINCQNNKYSTFKD